jgi:hypothetical protein
MCSRVCKGYLSVRLVPKRPLDGIYCAFVHAHGRRVRQHKRTSEKKIEELYFLGE